MNFFILGRVSECVCGCVCVCVCVCVCCLQTANEPVVGNN